MSSLKLKLLISNPLCMVNCFSKPLNESGIFCRIGCSLIPLGKIVITSLKTASLPGYKCVDTAADKGTLCTINVR